LRPWQHIWTSASTTSRPACPKRQKNSSYRFNYPAQRFLLPLRPRQELQTHPGIQRHSCGLQGRGDRYLGDYLRARVGDKEHVPAGTGGELDDHLRLGRNGSH
jgi:hypothetical protein